MINSFLDFQRHPNTKKIISMPGFIWFFAIVIPMCISCHSVPPCPTVAPYLPVKHKSVTALRLDPDIARIFSNDATQKPIGNFKWSPNSQTIAFVQPHSDTSTDTRLWVAEIGQQRLRPLFVGKSSSINDFLWLEASTLILQLKDSVIKLNIEGKRTELFQTAEPISNLSASTDGMYLAYTQLNNLFVFHLPSGTHTQLTYNEDSKVCSGCVSWLYEEEFGTAKGLQWSPKGHQLWFRNVDERQVSTRTIALSSSGEYDTISYSKAGQLNPLVKIGIVDMDAATPNVQWTSLPPGPEESYLPDVMWHPVENRLFLTRMDRLQTQFELLQCNQRNCEVVFYQNDPRWINYPGLPLFSNDGTQYALRLELTNFSHVHLFDSRTHAHMALTSGDYVVEQIHAITDSQVYFTANIETPLGNGIYKVAIKDGLVTPINSKAGHHLSHFSPDRTMYLDTFSTVDTSPKVQLFNDRGKALFPVTVGNESDYRLLPSVMNELTSFENSSGDTLYVHITRPKVVAPQKKYPALIYVYGGPRYQAVLNRYNTTFTAWRNLMADRGFIIFTVDNRGSSGRGREFEMSAHRNLIATALADQIEGVKWLSSKPYVDSKRIGIMGWSFGGTMTLAALLQTKNVFQLGIAIAPVTNWKNYDSAYTERYMQRPADNASNYKQTDLTQLADNLLAKLLLIHGTGDRNVLLEHSQSLFDKLVQAGKPVSTLFYPGANHSIDNKKTRAYMFTKITRFIEDNL